MKIKLRRTFQMESNIEAEITRIETTFACRNYASDKRDSPAVMQSLLKRRTDLAVTLAALKGGRALTNAGVRHYDPDTQTVRFHVIKEFDRLIKFLRCERQRAASNADDAVVRATEIGECLNRIHAQRCDEGDLQEKFNLDSIVEVPDNLQWPETVGNA